MSGRPQRIEDLTKPVGAVLRITTKEKIQDLLDSMPTATVEAKMEAVRNYLRSKEAPWLGVSEEVVMGKKRIAVHCPEVTYYFIPERKVTA